MQKIINFSENALNFLKQSIVEEKCLGMRIDVVSGGCSGMTYELNFVKEKKDEDLLVEENGVKTEAVSALTMLGFNAAASSKAVDKILKGDPTLKVEAVIREALKML